MPTRTMAFCTAVLSMAAASLTGAGMMTAPSARALTAPVAMTADELPTWQTNGIVWALAQADGVVFAGGTFSAIRPPGAAAAGNIGFLGEGEYTHSDRTAQTSGSADNHIYTGNGCRLVFGVRRGEPRVYRHHPWFQRRQVATAGRQQGGDHQCELHRLPACGAQVARHYSVGGPR